MSKMFQRRKKRQDGEKPPKKRSMSDKADVLIESVESIANDIHLALEIIQERMEANDTDTVYPVVDDGKVTGLSTNFDLSKYTDKDIEQIHNSLDSMWEEGIKRKNEVGKHPPTVDKEEDKDEGP